MFDQFTEHARRSIVLARDSAQALGHDEIDSTDLVIGLVTEEIGIAAAALKSLGVTRERLVRPTAPAPAGPPRRLPLAAELKTAIEATEREAVRDDHGINSGHLLLGIAGRPTSAGAQTLAALGIDVDAVRATLQGLAATGLEQGPTLAEAVAAVPLRPVPPLPGRAQTARSMAVMVIGFLIVASLVALAADDPEAVANVFVAVVAIHLVMVVALRWFLPGKVERRLARDASRQLAVPTDLVAVLAEHGVDHPQLRAQASRWVHNRCYRIGRRAWIVLAPSTIRNATALPFVLCHEAAHVIRNDSLRRRTQSVLLLSLGYGGLLSFTGRSLLIAVVGALLLRTALRWASELGADEIAARWAGIESMREVARAQHDMLRQPQNRTIWSSLRRLRGWLTHPPMRVRLDHATAHVTKVDRRTRGQSWRPRNATIPME